MKTIVKSAASEALRLVSYWLAIFQLRALETNLAGMCDALPSISCVETRANTTQAIRRLSLEVVEARNRARSLRNARHIQSWRAAA